MSNAQQNLTIDKSNTKETFTLRKVTRKEAICLVLLAGIIWLFLIFLWRRNFFTEDALLYLLTFLICIGGLLKFAFREYRVEIEGNQIKFQLKVWQLFSKRKLKLSEVQKVFAEFQGKWFGKKKYFIKAKLKSGEVITIASKVQFNNLAEAMAFTGVINNSLKRFQLTQGE